MAYLLYFLILVGFCLMLPRIAFFKKSGLPQRWLILFFLARAAAGAFNCFLSYHFPLAPDSLRFFNASLVENHWLKTYPSYFFRETFHSYGNNFSGLLATSSSFWNNLKSNVIIKPMAVLDLFTFRNFYINTLLFNIPVFAGSVALYRVLRKRLKINEPPLAIAVFLFPSGLFFTATIHREGLAWMALSVMVMMMDRIITKAFTWRRFAIVVFSFLLIFCIRNYLAFVIVPALLAWWLASQKKEHTAAINGLVVAMAVIVFFSLKYLIPQADFPHFIAQRSADFDAISRNSRTYLPMQPLTPDFVGFITNLPVAFFHSFVMPVIWRMHTYLEIPFIIELTGIEILFIIWLFKKKQYPLPITLFILFVCLVSIIMIGYTVPNMGAIIRYRSIYLHFIFILLLPVIFKKSSRIYTYY